MSDRETELRARVAETVVREAMERALALWHGRAGLAVERKGLQDLVSRADREIEELLRERIGRAFPGDAFLGEELGGEPAASLWIVDPIDGTANFLRGMPYWSITLAWVRDGVPQLAFTADPVHGELFAARRGHGTTRDGRPVRVSAVDRPEQACIGLSYTFKVPPEAYLETVRRLLDAGFDHRRMGSAALSLAHVADGRLDAAMTLLTNAWDVLPGLLLVEEAGGWATDWMDGCSLVGNRAAAAAAPGIAPLVAELTGIAMRPADRRSQG